MGAGRCSYHPCPLSCAGPGAGTGGRAISSPSVGTSAADHPAASMSKHVPGSSSVLHSTVLPGLCLGPDTTPTRERTGPHKARIPMGETDNEGVNINDNVW